MIASMLKGNARSHYLLNAEDLDDYLARYGLVPVESTRTVEAGDTASRRITVNGRYVKRATGSDAD